MLLISVLFSLIFFRRIDTSRLSCQIVIFASGHDARCENNALLPIFAPPEPVYIGSVSSAGIGTALLTCELSRGSLGELSLEVVTCGSCTCVTTGCVGIMILGVTVCSGGIVLIGCSGLGSGVCSSMII